MQIALRSRIYISIDNFMVKMLTLQTIQSVLWFLFSLTVCTNLSDVYDHTRIINEHSPHIITYSHWNLRISSNPFLLTEFRISLCGLKVPPKQTPVLSQLKVLGFGLIQDGWAAPKNWNDDGAGQYLWSPSCSWEEPCIKLDFVWEPATTKVEK